MMMSRPSLLALALGVAVAGCMDTEVLAPIAGDEPTRPPQYQASLLTCTGSTASGQVSCASDQPGSFRSLGSHLVSANSAFGSSSFALPAGIILGGQNSFIKLTSSGVTSVGGVFGFDVTLKNLIAQALGTTDGTNAAPEGVRVFFQQQPTITSGSGTIAIANADGTDAFSSAGQPYYQYNGILDPNETSGPKRWEFNFTGTVTFEFKVMVWAPVKYPDGWIIVTPSTQQLVMPSTPTVQLSGTIVDAVGRTVSSPPAITWGTSVGAVASVDGAGLVTAQGAGSATITATAGTYTGSSAITVIGLLDHFDVEAATGGDVGTQATGVPFDIRITAKDAAEQTLTSFTGTVALTSTPAGLTQTSGAFTAGVRTETVTITSGGSHTITATRSGGTEAGTSNSFTVATDVNAVSDDVSNTSAPSDRYHTPLNTALLVTDGADDLLANDDRGFPLANVTHFGLVQCNDGEGTLADATGVITANAAGATLDLTGIGGCSGGSLTVNADGTLTFTPASNYTGLFRFQYRIGNGTDTDDAQVTLAVGVRPTANNTTYTATLLGNVTFDTNTGTIAQLDAAGDELEYIVGSETGGDWTINSNGTFKYLPNVNYTGAAGFTYTVRNGFGTSSTASLSGLTVGALAVWFVDGAAASNGDGSQDSPFKDMTAVSDYMLSDGPAFPKDGDILFIHQNASPYGDLYLRTGIKVIGQDAGESLASILGLTLSPHHALPAMNSGDGTKVVIEGNVQLGYSNTLRGLTIGGAGYVTALDFGTLTVGTDLHFNTTGPAFGLINGELSGDIGSITAGGTGVYSAALYNVGGTSHLGGGTITAGSDAGLRIEPADDASFTYAGTITTAGGSALVVNGGDGDVTLTGNLTRTSGSRPIVSVVGGHSGTITVTGKISAPTGDGLEFHNADGTYDFSNVASGSGVRMINIGADSDGTFTFGANLSVTVSAGGAAPFNIASFDLTKDNSPTVTVNGTLTQNGAGPLVTISQLTTGASINLAGNMSGALTRGILIGSNEGGSITFSGATKTVSTGVNPAVELTDNPNTSIAFTNGGLAISATTGAGFTATGGGTVSVSGTGNSIQTTTGTALTLANITGGTGGLNFASVATNGAVTGIAISDLAGEGVTVTGSASLNATGTGIALSNIAGTIALTNATVTAPAGITGSAFGTLAGSGYSVTASAGAALTLSNGALGNATFNTLSSAGSPTRGISLTGVTGSATATGSIAGSTGSSFFVDGGSVSFVFNGGITQSSAQPMVDVKNGHTGTLTFQNGTLSASAGTGLQFDNADGQYKFEGTTTLAGDDAAVDIINGSSGTFIFGTSTSIQNPSGAAFRVNDSAPFVNYQGSITKTSAGLALDVANQSGGSLQFSTGTITASTLSTGIQLSNADGYVILTATVALSGSAGIDVIGGSTGKISFGNSTSITSPSGVAFYMNGSAPDSLVYAGTISSGSQRAVEISNTTNAAPCGTAIFAGNITGSGSSQGILIDRCNSGAAVFTANVSFNSGAVVPVTISNNTSGDSIRFSGGLSLTTTSANALNATSGVVSVTGNNNFLTSAGGIALNVNGATIGAGGLNFNTINANGGTGGIVLNNTGSVAGLTVNGGTIQNSSQRGASFVSVGAPVSLSNMTFSNANTADNPAAPSQNTGNCGNIAQGGNNSGCYAALHFYTIGGAITLTGITVSGTTATWGINVGSASAGMTLSNVNVTGGGSGFFEGAVNLQNVTGTVNVTNSNFTTSSDNHFRLINNSGTVTTNFSGGALNTNTQTNARGLDFQLWGTATGTLNLNGTPISGSKGTGLVFTQNASGTSGTVSIQSSSFSNNQTGILLSSEGTTSNVTISNNTFTLGANTAANSATVRLTGLNNASIGGATGVISNNTWGNGSPSSASCSGSGCSALDFAISGNARLTTTVSGNQMNGVGGWGMNGTVDNSARANMVITGNTFSAPSAGVTFDALRWRNLNISACSHLTVGSMAGGTGNTINGGTWNVGMTLSAAANSTFRLMNLPAGTAASWLTATNNFGGGSASATGVYTAGTGLNSC